MMKYNLCLTLPPKIYIKHILTTQFSISNCIKIKRSSQTKFYMQLDSIRNCKKKEGKKKKAFFVAKNKGLQLNQAKIL